MQQKLFNTKENCKDRNSATEGGYCTEFALRKGPNKILFGTLLKS
jgi:hypothetical protein